MMEQVLKVTDLLLQGGGFGMVVLDLGDIPPESARRVPLDFVVSFSPRRRAHRDCASAGGTGTLRQNLRVAGGAVGT